MIIDFLDDDSLSNCWNPYIFKFKTNAINFRVKMNLFNKPSGEYPHTGITLREGFCMLFRFSGQKTWYNIDAYARKNNVLINMKPVIDENAEYEVIIYGPNLCDISKFVVEIPDEYYAKKINNSTDKEIIIIGGMQSLGIGCTTSGVMFSNILCRKLECKHYRITSNSKNYMEKIAEFLDKNHDIPYTDIGILEINFIASYDEKDKKTLLKLLKYLEKHCEKVICWFSIPKTETELNNILNLLKQTESAENFIIKDFSFLYDNTYSEMCTLTNELINDTGNILIYKELEKCILEIDKWNI